MPKRLLFFKKFFFWGFYRKVLKAENITKKNLWQDPPLSPLGLIQKLVLQIKYQEEIYTKRKLTCKNEYKQI